MKWIDKYISAYSDNDFPEDTEVIQEALDDIFNIQISKEEINFLYPIFSEKKYFAGWHDVFGFVVKDFAEWLQGLQI